MDGVLVWALAVVFVVAAVLNGRRLLDNPDDSFLVNALYFGRAFFAALLAALYLCQIFDLLEPVETVALVRGIGVPATFVAYVFPALIPPRAQAVASKITDEVRRRLGG